MSIKVKWGIVGAALFILGAYTESPFFMLIGFIGVLAALFCDAQSLTMQGSSSAKQIISHGPCNIRIVSVGIKRLGVMVALKQLGGLGLKEAKQLMDSAPVEFMSGISEEDARYAKEVLEQEGAVVVVTSSIGKELTDIRSSLYQENQQQLILPQLPVMWMPGSYQAILTDAGEKKISVVKVTREVFKLGLKEAKDLIDSAPVVLITGISKENAQYVQTRYENEGAQVIAVLSEPRLVGGYHLPPVPTASVTPHTQPVDQSQRIRRKNRVKE